MADGSDFQFIELPPNWQLVAIRLREALAFAVGYAEGANLDELAKRLRVAMDETEQAFSSGARLKVPCFGPIDPKIGEL